MTLQQFMLAYQENKRDIFALHYSDETEIARVNMNSYFCEDFDTAFGDCLITEFIIEVVSETSLVISIFLDIPNGNED